MERANIAIFEDDESLREMLGMIAALYGHDVTAYARSMPEAVAVIETMAAGEIDVAIVDGNLDRQKIDGHDGAEITRLLHEKFEDTVVIGFSASGDVEGADHNIPKAGINPLRDITDLITQL